MWVVTALALAGHADEAILVGAATSWRRIDLIACNFADGARSWDTCGILQHVPGLYDDEFVGFRTATQHELNTALREAVVAVDANVLLGLYRFLPQTTADLIRVLERLEERLVVPHQSLREFWRHRQRAAGSPEAATRVVEEAIGKATASVRQALETWSKQVGLDAVERTALLQRVAGFADEVRDELAIVHTRTDARSSDADPILASLERLLDGRVTNALTDEQWDECVAEGHRRVDAEEPPGYRDATKQEGDLPEGAAGDYLVWFQATRYAAERDADLVIVTADEKEDWWWRQQSALLGPRPELTLEYYRLTGRRLFMMRPQDLLARAGALDVVVDEKSLADADRVSEEEAARPVAWTSEAFLALLDLLDDQAPVPADAIRLAAQSGGRVSRDEVYELGGFPDDRMLRGFTRPVVRLTTWLQGRGIVPEGVLPMLVARYPDGVKASYFSVPPEIPGIYAELSTAAGTSSPREEGTRHGG